MVLEPEVPKSELGKLVLCVGLILVVIVSVAWGVIRNKTPQGLSLAETMSRQARAKKAKRSTVSAKQEQQTVAPTTVTPTYQPPTVSWEPVQPPAFEYHAPEISSYAPPVEEHPLCNYCNGSGKIDEECSKCDGLGELECSHCEAYNARFSRGGDPNCPECHGTARQTNAVGERAFGTAFYYTCSLCHGAKQVKASCPVCHGLGHT